MTWLTGRSQQTPTALPLMRESPRLLPTAPIRPDFNLSFEAEDEVSEHVESDSVSLDLGNAQLQAELNAWDAASDEAFEGTDE